jgi:hypothetical protein
MNILFTNLYIFLLATIFALLEIQIEGSQGWAKNLPTWRLKKQILGKELTGYHLLIFSLAFLIFHFPYAFDYQLTLIHELKILSLFFLFVVLWDFLWFVLNPNFPLKSFKKENIWWHKNWFLKTPIDYFLGILASFLIILPTMDFTWWFLNLALFASYTFFTIFITLFIVRIDNWKK